MYNVLAGVIFFLSGLSGYLWYSCNSVEAEFEAYKREALIAQYQAVAEKNVIENKTAEKLTTLRERYQNEISKLDSAVAASKRLRNNAAGSQNRMSGVSSNSELAADAGRVRSEHVELRTALEKCAVQYRTLFEAWKESCELHSCTKAPAVR